MYLLHGLFVQRFSSPLEPRLSPSHQKSPWAPSRGQQRKPWSNLNYLPHRIFKRTRERTSKPAFKNSHIHFSRWSPWVILKDKGDAEEITEPCEGRFLWSTEQGFNSNRQCELLQAEPKRLGWFDKIPLPRKYQSAKSAKHTQHRTKNILGLTLKVTK